MSFDPDHLEALARRVAHSPDTIGNTARRNIAEALRELARIKRDGTKPPEYPDWITRTNREN